MDYEKTLRTVLDRKDLRLSPDEEKALAAAPNEHLIAKKVLAAHYYNTGRMTEALEISKVVFEADPTAENENNYLSSLHRAGRFEEVLELAKSPDTKLSPIRQATRICEVNSRMGRHDEAREWGQKALQMKDDEVARVETDDPVLHRFDPAKPERNIIAFSLWGRDMRYLDGAVRNAVVARHLYPGWTARFYIDDSVPKEAQAMLSANGAELRTAPKLPAAQFGLFWRFLVEDDPEVDLYIVRDADSVLNIKERVAVQDWLESGQPFHVMRDFSTHCELVLAGMWGAHRGNIPDMGKRFYAYQQARAKTLNNRAIDQQFLRDEIWPLMRGRMCCHDSVFGFGATHEYSERFPLTERMHIGQNDAVLRPKVTKKPT